MQVCQGTDLLEYRIVGETGSLVTPNSVAKTSSLLTQNSVAKTGSLLTPHFSSKNWFVVDSTNSAVKINSLLPPQFGSENWFIADTIIQQRELIRCWLHNLAAKIDSLLTPQFSRETDSLGKTYGVEITSPHELLLIQKLLMKIKSLPTQKSSTQHNFQADVEIFSAYGLQLTHKLLTKLRRYRLRNH